MLSHFLERRSQKTWALIIFVLTFCLYLPHVGHGFIGIDDPRLITENPLVQHPSLSNLFQAFLGTVLYLYVPLTVVSSELTSLVFGLNPQAFHTIDALLHALNATLVFFVIGRLTGKHLVAVLVALLFAVHPLQVEAVAWASARKDTLSTVFLLLSCLSYLRFLDEHAKGSYWKSVIFYTLGLLAKIAVVPLPLLFVLIAWQRERRWTAADAWPFVVVGFLPVVISIVGGSPFLVPLGAVNMVLLAGKATAYLLTSLVWPASLTLLHLEHGAPTFRDPLVLAGLPSLLLLCGTLTWFIVTGKARTYSVGIGLFLLFLAPTFATAQKAGLLFFTSDKYAYVPSIGAFLCLALAADTWWRRSRAAQPLIITGTVVILFAFATMTTHYASAWQDSESIYRAALRVDPSNAVALNNLGLELAAKGETDKAIDAYDRAIASDPHYAAPYINESSVLMKAGRIQDAFALYARIGPILTAREVRGDDAIRRGMLWLADRFRDSGKAADELALLERLRYLAPSAPDIQARLGDAYDARGDETDALFAYEKAASFHSDNVNVYYHLAEFYSAQNRTPDLIRVLRRAVQIDPTNQEAVRQLRMAEGR